MRHLLRTAAGAGLVIFLWSSPAAPARAEVSIAYPAGSAQLQFAVARLDRALRLAGQTPAHHDSATRAEDVDVLIISGQTKPPVSTGPVSTGLAADPAVAAAIKKVPKEGFQILKVRAGNRSTLCLIAPDDSGAMYATLDLAEQIEAAGGLDGVQQKLSQPRFPFRAIKFNLPWSSYRPNENPSMHLHTETCRDLKFWERFLDMMAENRFNALTLWNLHPFPYMIRPKNFPEARPFSDAELADWQEFWQALFRMAKHRGIETYIVNWNIFVSPEFTKAHRTADYQNSPYHYGDGDTSELVQRYNRECVAQVIEEYKDLTGLGISLGERMNQMTPQARQDWITTTFIKPIKQAGRPVKFIHRAPFSIDPKITRSAIESSGLDAPVWVPIKFNWSHGHSTADLRIIHGGRVDDSYWNPPPKNYKIIWTVRNEDFFVLRWGQPDFIREHIATNGKDYVGGYIVGSEGYIPAKDYSHKPGPHVTWQYAFEKQWLFYQQWGRLLYDPDTPDKVFSNVFDRRYGKGVGDKLLKAYSLASRMPLRLASFHAATWDFTLYSEGFLAPAQTGLSDKASPFISINELIDHKTLDPTYVSIVDYVKSLADRQEIDQSLVTPLELADELEKDGTTALKLLGSLPPAAGPLGETLACEVADVEAWAHLSLYFADKLRAGVALQTLRKGKVSGEKTRAVTFLQQAAGHWQDLVAATKPHYQEIPAVQLAQSEAGHAETFSWEKYIYQVQQDIAIAVAEPIPEGAVPQLAGGPTAVLPTTPDIIPRFGANSPFDGDYQPPVLKDGKRLWASSFRWAKAPKLNAERWLGKKPDDTKGKYMLIAVWATWCSQCRRSIPLLNQWHHKFGEELAVIGISDETEEVINKMKEPKIEFFSAIDTRGRLKDELGAFGIPHVIIVEPEGYVIWEGFPLQPGYELTDEIIEKILAVGRKLKAKAEK